MVVSQDEKENAVFGFYENILGKAAKTNYTLDLDELAIPFLEEEVWATIKDMYLDKALGPDGFMGRFYKSCWSIIKGDVLMALDAIQRGHVFKFCLLNTDCCLRKWMRLK